MLLSDVLRMCSTERQYRTLNPSAWSDERCSCRENITCRGVMGTACRAALSHSLDYISTT
jgi:hypothetical protein